MKHLSRSSLPLVAADETTVRQRFQQARRDLQPAAVSTPAPNPTPSDWRLLSRIQTLLDYAFTSGDWQGAKREIEAIKRRAQIHVVTVNSAAKK